MEATPLADLFARIDRLRAEPGRRIVGLAGPPGSGKSTLAQQLVERAGADAVGVPMDGFHLANTELRRLGRSDRKGAPDTFDSAGYVALLRRIRAQTADEIIYAPEFRRDIEEPIAGAIPVLARHALVITEGNYLLLDSGHWAAIRSLVDEIWYIDIEPQLRLTRLIALAAHVRRRFGRDELAMRAAIESHLHADR